MVAYPLFAQGAEEVFMRRFFVVFTVCILAIALSLGSLAQKSKGKEEPKKAEESQKIEDLVTKGEYQKAIDLAKKFIDAGKVTVGLYIDMGTAYYKLKQYDEAVKAYDEAFKLDMFSTQALLFEATTYHDMGQDEKVVDVYQKVLGIEPANNEVRYDLAQLYEKLNKNDEAIKEYETLYAAAPDFKDVAYATAVLYHNKGQMDKAEPYFDKALSLNPTSDEVLLAQGQNFLKEKKYDKAVVPLQKFVEISKNEALKPAVLRQIAGAYTKLGAAITLDPKAKPEDKKAAQDAINANYNNAILYFDKLLALKPNSEEGLEGKANALIHIGNNTEAVAVLEQFMQVSKNDTEKKKVADTIKQLKAAKKG